MSIFDFNQFLQFCTPRKLNIAPGKMVDGRLLSYKESNFSGAMLNFGRVSEIQKIIDITGYGFAWILT